MLDLRLKKRICFKKKIFLHVFYANVNKDRNLQTLSNNFALPKFQDFFNTQFENNSFER